MFYDVMLLCSMETKVAKIDVSNINSDIITEAASFIDSGALVAFPTETVYGIACRAEVSSLNKLNNIKKRGVDKHYTIHIGQKNDATKYLPNIGLKAKKLIDNAWPGPLTIIFELKDEQLCKQREIFDDDVFDIIYKDKTIGLRCPDNPIASMLLQNTNYPVVAPSANKTGDNPSFNAEQVMSYFSSKIDYLLDGGPCKYKKSSTIVKISNNRLKILRPGVYTQSDLKAMSDVKFLFVCTGNICRSPMAVGIFRKQIAEKLKCNVDELNQIGYIVSSAGIMGMTGTRASTEAIKACESMGINIDSHISQALSTYDKCAESIAKAIRKRISELNL